MAGSIRKRRSVSSRFAFAFDVGDLSRGNQYSNPLTHYAQYYGGTTPVLDDTFGRPQGRKFDVTTIDVAYLRRDVNNSSGVELPTIPQDSLSTDPGTPPVPGAFLSIAPTNENGGVLQSNLRIRDNSVSQYVSGETLTFFMGPVSTSAIPGANGILKYNYCAQATPSGQNAQVYNVKLNLMNFLPGGNAPPAGTGITAANVQEIQTEANRIFGQVGIQFNWLPAATINTSNKNEWDVPDDGAPEFNSFRSLADPAALANVFLVDTLDGRDWLGFGAAHPLNGSTAWVWSGTGPWRKSAGLSIVATQFSKVAISDLTRTIAHELGHWIFDSGMHADLSWNLMRPGQGTAGFSPGVAGSPYNSDLTLAESTLLTT